MSVLFFDTETTGLPNFKLPIDAPEQPRICQIAMILAEDDGKVVSEASFLIKPDGWEIPEKLTELHGVSQYAAHFHGVAIKTALSIFYQLKTNVDMVVAHNISFDDFMLRREVAACGFEKEHFEYKKFCTMNESKNIVKLPPSEAMQAKGMTGYKSPNLQEAYKHYFGTGFEGAHDAMVDVRACKDIFYKLMSDVNYSK